MFAIYENIITHPIFWVFALMTLAVFAIQSTVTMKVAPPNVNKRWLRQNYVMLLLLVATTLAVSATVFYLFEIGISVAGLVNILRESVADPTTTTEDFRNLATAVGVLMGVLAASATIFFSIIRVWMNERTASAAEKSLFNDKISAAVSDLHAQRQVTKWDEEDKTTGWEDDVTRRNGAIDRLLGLAKEEPESAPRIARMLSVYVKELSRELPAEDTPKTDDPKVLVEWANTLKFERSDMPNAVQVMAKLRQASNHPLDNKEIDLSETNLQGFDLLGLKLEGVFFKNAHLQGAKLGHSEFGGANFFGAKLHGARLNGTRLEGAHFFGGTLRSANLSTANLKGANLYLADLQDANLSSANLMEADLSHAKLKGTNLKGTKFQGVNLTFVQFDSFADLSGSHFANAAFRFLDFSKNTITQEQLVSAFGDASVVLPAGKGPNDPEWPEHWSKEKLDLADFLDQWDAFKAKNRDNPGAP